MTDRKRMLLAVFLLSTGFLAAAEPAMTIQGVTLDCSGGKRLRTAGVEVFVFPKSAPLTRLMDNVTQATDATVLERFNDLIAYVKKTKALAHARTDRSGNSIVRVTEHGKLVIIGYLETEDDPLYWMHAETDTSNRSTVAATLDHCRP